MVPVLFLRACRAGMSCFKVVTELSHAGQIFKQPLRRKASDDMHPERPEPEGSPFDYSQEEFIDAEAVISDAAALAADFERLCTEFTCPEQAKAYGTDYHRQGEEDGLAQCSHSENTSSIPKKGSLRVFAQQVCTSIFEFVSPAT
jgi:hypothetical protein